VLPNPRRYNPTGDQRYVANRSSLIYSIMVKRGIVIPEYSEVTGGGSSSSGDDRNVGPIERLKPAD